MQVLRTFWGFFQKQTLGMNWLCDVIGSGLSTIGMGISNRRVSGAVQHRALEEVIAANG